MTTDPLLASLRAPCPLPAGSNVFTYARDSGGDTQERSVDEQIRLYDAWAQEQQKAAPEKPKTNIDEALAQRRVVEQVGAIDARYFYFWEETEWCMRARKAGWRVVQVPGAKLWHKGVQRDYRPAPTVTYYATRNRLLTMAKHGAPGPVRFAAWMQIARTMTSWTVRPKWRGMREHRHAMWRGATDFVLGRLGGPVRL